MAAMVKRSCCAGKAKVMAETRVKKSPETEMQIRVFFASED